MNGAVVPRPPSLVDCGDGFVGCAPTTGSLDDVLDISNGWDNCETFQCIVDHAVPDGFSIDMHTFNYERGEIRGQLRLVPSQVVGFFPPASKPTWKGGRTVPIDLSELVPDVLREHARAPAAVA
jgi:hypothetical protein